MILKNFDLRNERRELPFDEIERREGMGRIRALV